MRKEIHEKAMKWIRQSKRRNLPPSRLDKLRPGTEPPPSSFRRRICDVKSRQKILPQHVKTVYCQAASMLSSIFCKTARKICGLGAQLLIRQFGFIQTRPLLQSLYSGFELPSHFVSTQYCLQVSEIHIVDPMSPRQYLVTGSNYVSRPQHFGRLPQLGVRRAFHLPCELSIASNLNVSLLARRRFLTTICNMISPWVVPRLQAPAEHLLVDCISLHSDAVCLSTCCSLLYRKRASH